MVNQRTLCCAIVKCRRSNEIALFCAYYAYTHDVGGIRLGQARLVAPGTDARSGVVLSGYGSSGK